MRFYKNMKKNTIYIIIIICLTIFSCGDNMNKNITGLNTLSLKNIPGKKIYFGHQSVGYNIIDGIQDLSRENSNIKLKVLETNNPEYFKESIFAHSLIGENENPESKIDSFVNLMEKSLGKKVDIAFFKFCYVDIVNKSDIKVIFNYYKDEMNKLHKEFPKVKFIHLTVPLTTNDKMPYGFINKFKFNIKKLLGRDTEKGIYIGDNIKRNLFNEMLLNEYNENVFDLSKFESLLPNGQREKNISNNTTFYSLVRDYTIDGGHLNKTGRIIMAYRLLEFIENLK
jgi:hypothetical protein